MGFYFQQFCYTSNNQIKMFYNYIKLSNKWLSSSSSVVSSLFKTAVNTTRINTNFYIYFAFYFNILIFCKEQTFTTIKIIFILLEFFLFSFILSYSFSTLFIDINSSRLIFKSIKILDSKTSMVYNLACVSNTILSCFFFFF